jgi:hypothetical protein
MPEDDTSDRIRAARERTAQAAERTAVAHERAAEEHEHHADVAEEIGVSLKDAHSTRERAQRVRANAVRDHDIARREREAISADD